MVPCDSLPIEDEEVGREMGLVFRADNIEGSWANRRHPNLFGCYITNFSCGPDSFLVGYVRDTMGRKPFLVLELDSHVADAGLETRIEAFIDIIRNYREMARKRESMPGERSLKKAWPFSAMPNRNS